MLTLSHLLDRAWILIENSQRIGEKSTPDLKVARGERRRRRWTKDGIRERFIGTGAMYPRRCVDHDLGGVVSRPSMGREGNAAREDATHGCKDLSRTCLSSLSRLMSLFRNVHVRFPAGCTGCNEWPVPRLDRSTPSERGCNRDPKTLIPKNRRIPFLFIAEENKICCFEKRDF